MNTASTQFKVQPSRIFLAEFVLYSPIVCIKIYWIAQVILRDSRGKYNHQFYLATNPVYHSNNMFARYTGVVVALIIWK